MKPIWGLVLVALLFALPAKADSIQTVNLGPPGPLDIQGSQQQMTFALNLAGTPIQGQDQITVEFANGESLSSDWYFDADIDMATDGPPCAGFTSGTGYFFGASGQPLFSPIALGNACGSNSALGTGIEFPPVTQNVYGMVFDVDFPSEPGATVTVANLLLSFNGQDECEVIVEYDDENHVPPPTDCYTASVNPGLPAETPEPETWALLGMGLLGLALMKFAHRGKRLKASVPLSQ